MTWDDIEGRLRRDGLRADELLDGPADELVPIVFSYFVEDATPPDGNRALGREIAVRILRGEDLSEAAADGGPSVDESTGWPTPSGRRPAEPDRETWGLLPEHQAGLQRAMGIMGPTLAATGGAPDA